ncbi:hypothetical protein [Campylobacter concisus]|uniref:hypothetical protein n=1 Tax=Campylobacter concisus TaxID=199 RepID=UPI000CD7E640|nr:hypothetical protein [Campylobacter concisus]
MKYANYDKETNEILGYYDDEIHESIPEPNIKISDEAWQEALAIGANSIKDGKMIYVSPKIDEKAKQLAQLEADITECKDDIRHALIIGNASVLENLRNEYKSLLAEREKLQEQE